MQPVVITILALTYPFLVYLAITHGVSWLVPTLLAMIFLRRFYHSSYSDWKFVLIASLLLLGAIFFQTLSAKVIPVFMHAAMFLVFYRSLQTDASLIERFARLDFPELPDGIPQYCRQVTWVWSVFFAVNVLLCSALALWADDALWALYNGAIIYLLLGMLMMVEYIFRRLRFPNLEVKPFKQSMMNMIKNGHTVWDSK
ncbi:MAG: hypothetical protein Q9M11_08480 [Mariprofundaceae bacterium]|nr:hypothetical protein [Mariprofundaceae bacterium]